MTKPTEPPGKPPKPSTPADGVTLTVLDGPWGRVGVRAEAVTSLRGEVGDTQTHVGLPCGEVPVFGNVEQIAAKLNLNPIWAPDPEPEPKPGS